MLAASTFSIALAVVGIIILLILGLIMINFFGLWIQARAAGTPVSLMNLVFMRFRKVHPGVIVNSRITASKAGLNYSTDQLEAHYLAGGDIVNVARAYTPSRKKPESPSPSTAPAPSTLPPKTPARLFSKRSEPRLTPRSSTARTHLPA